MKVISKASLILNFGFAAWVACLLANGRKPNSIQPPTQIPSSPISQASSPISSLSPEPTAKPFRWVSIESTNYRIYIANLRGIECPEQTIRDLITADVDASLYSPRRDQLKERMEGKIKAAPEGAVFAQEEYKRDLEQLKTEESALIASLLGTQSSEPSAGAIATGYRPRAANPPEMPLVFQDVDPAALHLTDAQVAIINGIKQDFLQQIGGMNQDPNDPAYRQKWMPAQRQADDMLKGMLGSTFVQNYELQVMQQSEQAKQPRE